MFGNIFKDNMFHDQNECTIILAESSTEREKEKVKISTLLRRSGHERKRAPVKTLFATLIGSLFNV